MITILPQFLFHIYCIFTYYNIKYSCIFIWIGDIVNNKNVRKKSVNKKNNTDKITPDVVKRLNAIKIIVFLLLLLLIGKLFFIEIIQGAKYKELAYKQQTINRIISPKRGTIYDSTGKALAVSSRVDTVTINPR